MPLHWVHAQMTSAGFLIPAYILFTCGEACKSRDDKKSVGGGAGVVVCPELLSKEEVELWFCPELLSQTLVNGKNDA